MAKKFEIQKQGFPGSVAAAYNNLLGIKSDSQVVLLPLSQLDEIEDQPFPINDSKVDQIADSIDNVGVIEPIIVVKNGERYNILSGRHRYRACQKVGKTEIPCYIKETDETTARYILIATNTDRNNEYSPIVYARAYAEYIDLMKKMGRKAVVNAISEQSGMNRKQIYRYLRLNYLIPELQKWVENSVLTIEAAVELSFLSDEKQLAFYNHLNDLGIADNVISRTFKVDKTKSIRQTAEELSDEEFSSNIDKIIFGHYGQERKTETVEAVPEPEPETRPEPEMKPETMIPAEEEIEEQPEEPASVIPFPMPKKEKMGLEAPKIDVEADMNKEAILFKDNRHENAFYQILDKMKLSSSDPERVALAYLLALNEDCRKHISDLYDFEERVILPEGLDREWQTHISLKTARMAFNLYNGYCYDNKAYIGSGRQERDLPSEYYYSPVHLFACSYAPYYWEAIKLRYPEYTEED